MVDSGLRKPVVFTDLDGTLLDHDSYSWVAAKPALDELKRIGSPCIFNSSKTLAEMLQLARETGVCAPLICENGGGVAIPAGWQPGDQDCGDYRPQNYRLHALGAPRERILEQLEPLRGRYRFRSYCQMSAAEVAQRTGLAEPDAENSMQRNFTEPCVWEDSDAAFDQFRQELENCDLLVQRGGRFAHVMGRSDKGGALKWCMARWFDESNWLSVAAGDGENDIAMLDAADIAILVRSQHLNPPHCANPNSRLTDDYGPAGWSGAILAELNRGDL